MAKLRHMNCAGRGKSKHIVSNQQPHLQLELFWLNERKILFFLWVSVPYWAIWPRLTEKLCAVLKCLMVLLYHGFELSRLSSWQTVLLINNTDIDATSLPEIRRNTTVIHCKIYKLRSIKGKTLGSGSEFSKRCGWRTIFGPVSILEQKKTVSLHWRISAWLNVIVQCKRSSVPR